MKYLTFVALFAIANVKAADDEELPEEAIGDCEEDADCTEDDEYCVFNVTIDDDDNETWVASVCGTEADCTPDEADLDDGQYIWCEAFSEDEDEDEDEEDEEEEEEEEEGHNEL
jgi:hypothetical protein